MLEYFLEPTQASGAAIVKRNIPGEIVMLNLLRFREVADYSSNPELTPETPISGKQAFQKYIDHALPFLEKYGGELLLLGDGGSYFIGPGNEHWDMVMLVRQSSVQSFFSFASNSGYVAGLGHRTAAIIDSRLLPVVEHKLTT